MGFDIRVEVGFGVGVGADAGFDILVGVGFGVGAGT